MKVLAVDPGSVVSGVVICEGDEILFAVGEMENQTISSLFDRADVLVLERFVLHDAVGASCAETLLWTGRFWEAWYQAKQADPVLLTRIKVTSTLKLAPKRVDGRSMDSKARELMLSLYGDKTKNPKVTKHAWQALALYSAYRIIQSGNQTKGKSKRRGRGFRASRSGKLVFLAGRVQRDLKRAVGRRLHTSNSQENLQRRCA